MLSQRPGFGRDCSGFSGCCAAGDGHHHRGCRCDQSRSSAWRISRRRSKHFPGSHASLLVCRSTSEYKVVAADSSDGRYKVRASYFNNLYLEARIVSCTPELVKPNRLISQAITEWL